MSAIHVCSLARVALTVEETGASHLATLINAGTPVARPARIPADNHLFLGFNDITEPTEGLIPPGEEHVRRLIRFVRDWDRSDPMVIHCWAGISRSTAGAFIAACTLMPDADEEALAREIRARSPSATPNLRLVRLADPILGRGGRMVEAIEAIGRGRDAFEGDPFSLALKIEA
ncbi:tyrosine phosphatase family protein [Prosthecomicrobium sp. N25]|uniref:tyrosine phosphatase family protein n=1 Tax=Prosthecomicrobium sp. N25 TaxID=3129254 RepID=UPI0030789C4F